MPGTWKEVVRLRFKGARFRDHALDLSALAEIGQFLNLVAETAKAMWRASNPDRERLPPHFEQRTRICLRHIDDGSAAAPLEVLIDDGPGLFEREPEEVTQAVQLAHEVFEAVERNSPLPDRFPRHLVSEYAKWGQSLADDEEVELVPPNKAPARLCPMFRDRLAKFAETPYEAGADITGEVFAADVRQRRFHIWREDGTSVSACFSEQQEDVVTTALRDHKSIRVRVRGRGEYLPSGQLQRIILADSVEPIRPAPLLFDANAPDIETVLAEIAAQVPAEEWDRLPADLTDNLDHYIYGTPKR